MNVLTTSVRLLSTLGLAVVASIPACGQTYVDAHDFGFGNDGTLPYHEVTLDGLGNLYGTTLYGGPELAGLVWKISASGNYQILHVFGGAYNASIPDGNDPKGGVTVDSSGNLYGTTVGGGATGGGILWEITSSGKYIDLHDFGSGNDGLGPEAGVTIDRFGNLYGTTCFVGANGGGTVWEFTASGQYLDLHDFGAGADGAGPQAGVTIDAFGNLFGTTYKGGANSWGMAWELTASGQYRDLHDFGVGADGVRPIGGVTVDGSGNLYGTTYSSGQSESGPGIVWEITASGIYQGLHAFGSSGDGSQPNAGVAIDSAGSLYGTTTEGGAYKGGVLWSLANGQYRVLHSFGSGADGTKPLAGVTIDTAGNLYGATYDGGANGASCGMVWEITAAALNQLTVSPTSVVGGASATGAVKLSNAAPAGGLKIGLSSSSTSVTVPTSVTVAAGSTSATFSIATVPVTTSISATISGTLGSTSQSATLTVDGPLLSGVSLNPASVVGGSMSTGTVTLGRPAPSGGAAVTLASNSTSATLPGSVTIAAGSTSATFLVSTTPVAAAVSATISAAIGGTTATATLTIAPISLAGLTLNPAIVDGGSSSTGTVTLSGPAGTSGAVVSLSTSNLAASPPASVTIAPGQVSSTFAVKTVGVPDLTRSTITATLDGASRQATLTISPPTLASVNLNPSLVVGSASSTGLILINGVAGPGGLIVGLGSSNPSASLPSSVTISPGRSSATFVVTTAAVAAAASATITANLNGRALTSMLTIVPVGIASIALSPTAAQGGSTSTGTVTLKGPAPKGGLVVKLSSNASIVTVPATVRLAAGTTTVTFVAKTTAVSIETAAAVTAKLASVSLSATLTVMPAALSAIKLNPSSVAGGASSTGTVLLTGPAGAAGLVVKLSSNSASAIVPASVTVRAGQISATFKIVTASTAAGATATISASSNGQSVQAVLSIIAPKLTSLTLSPSSVQGGQSSTAMVTLSSVAPPGGIIVSLSATQSRVSVPGAVSIPTGKTSASFKIKTSGVTSKTSATISATLGETVKSAVLTVT